MDQTKVVGLTHIAVPLLTALAVGGCLGDPTIDFHVCGDPAVPGDIDALRMSVLDSDMNERHAAVLELVDPKGDVLETLPVNPSIPAGSGLGWARLEALKEGVEVIVFARRVGDLETQHFVNMPISIACLGITCPLGQTCVKNEGSGDGECVLAPSGDDPPTCPGGT